MWLSLARFLSRHPLAVVSLAAALALASALYAATHLGFTGSRGVLAGAQGRQRQLQESFARSFAARDPLVVVARGAQPRRVEAFAEALAERLAEEPASGPVRYRVDAGRLEAKGLLYLPLEELRRLRARLEDDLELLRRVAASPTLATLLDEINRKVGQGLVGHLFTGFLGDAGGGGDAREPDLGLLLPVLTGMAAAAEGRRTAVDTWEAWFAATRPAEADSRYLWGPGKEFLFVLVEVEPTPGRLNRFADPVGRVRAAVAEVRRAFPEVEAGVTGGPALDADEMTAIQRDMAVASLISLAGVTVLLWLAFRSPVPPALGVCSLVMGICWAFGFAALTVGRLNIISASLAPMLIGLGIDHNIHLLTRLEREQWQRPNGLGLARALAGVGPSVCKAALTIAAAFYALVATGYRGLMELGLLAGTGVLLTLLAALTVLPALVALHRRWRKAPPAAPARVPPRAPGPGSARLRWLVLGLGTAAAVAGAASLARVRSDMNPLTMQPRESEAVAWASRLLQSRDVSGQQAVVLASSLAEARAKAEALRALPQVRRVESLADWMPLEQAEKLAILEDVAGMLEDVTIRRPERGAETWPAVTAVLGRIRFKVAAPEGGGGRGAAQRDRARTLIDRVQAALEGERPDRARRGLRRYGAHLMGDLAEKLDRLRGAAALGPISPLDLPDWVRQRFLGTDGRYAVMVYPRGDPWDPAERQGFLAAVRAVDPVVVGDLPLLHEDTALLADGYRRGALYALAGGFLLLCLAFRNLGHSLTALVPLGLSVAWSAGLMAALGLRINLANLVALPLLVGVSIEHGTVLVQGLRERGRHNGGLHAGTLKGITLACLTSMVGFGSLMAADHRGAFSAGLLLFLSIGTVLIASVGFVPALFAAPPAGGARPAAGGGGPDATWRSWPARITASFPAWGLLVFALLERGPALAFYAVGLALAMGVAWGRGPGRAPAAKEDRA